jgi:subtilisin-like proprotein convertase family protein
MACEQCSNLNDPGFVCVSVFPDSGPSAGEQLDYGFSFVSFAEIGGQTYVTYEVCNCNPGAQASGISHVNFQLCPDSPTVDVEATVDANGEGDTVEIRNAGQDDMPFASVKINFGTSIDAGLCRNVILVYNETGVIPDDFGGGNVGVKIGGGSANVPTTANYNFGLPLLGCANGDEECPDDCSNIICGDTNNPFDCTITVCDGFDLVEGSAQAAICSGNIVCTETFCRQNVEVTLCDQTFPCCVEVPLRRLQGTLTIVTSARFTDPCNNEVALCCQQDVDIDVICPACLGENCDDLPLLCELFAVSVGQPSQQNPGDDVIINGVVINRCSCVESTETFTNDDGITIPADNPPGNTAGQADPYPSTIEVSGLSGAISNVTVTLNDFTHTFPADVDVMLVAPDGMTNTILMTNPDTGTDVTNIDLTFDDAAATPVPCGSQLTSGTYQPTICGSPDFISAPTPNPVVALSNFVGIDPNGTWSLYVEDDFGADVGSIASWSITITTTCP